MQTAAQKEIPTVKFLIDRQASRFTVQAFATGLLSTFGHNPVIGMRDFDGEIHFLAETHEQAAVRVTLRTAALEILDEIKSDDRKKLEQSMYNDVLEVQRFPGAVYESKNVAIQKLSNDLLLVRASGDLTFHGVTQPQTMEARVTDLRTLLRISGDFSLRQSDYGIKPFSFAGGALRLKDELKFKFEFVARQQD
jgi:polyisoprenoid-binding protein YceI